MIAEQSTCLISHPRETFFRNLIYPFVGEGLKPSPTEISVRDWVLEAIRYLNFKLVLIANNKKGGGALFLPKLKLQ